MISIDFELSPLISHILEKELADGNQVVEVSKGWPHKNSKIILMGKPFQKKYEVDGLAFRKINDPYYWKEEYEETLLQRNKTRH